jgi:hypothetical protein
MRSMKIARNPIFHASTKHIESHYHFVCKKVMLREVELVHKPTSEQLVDIFTKALGKNKFEKMRLKLKSSDSKHNNLVFRLVLK